MYIAAGSQGSSAFALAWHRHPAEQPWT